MRKFVLAVVLVLMAGGAQAVTLNVVGGQLMGATDVLVDGNLYDVQFLDGTCIDRYNGCDDVSDFTFQTLASASLASQALLDQVFLDVGFSGLFDSLPSLTNGCISSNNDCAILTPWTLYGGGFDSVGAVNVHHLGGVDSISASIFANTSVNTTGLFITFAVWDASVVPEPSTALLLGLGLTGLAAKGRRRNRS